MLVALTVRKLKPGSVNAFRQAFEPEEGDDRPKGWKRFYAIRNVDDVDEVITFGFFDGTLEDLRASQQEGPYTQRRGSADEFVESISADGVYEILDERTFD
jgi:heme-degrading monooxygenase HmoA